MGYKVAKNGDCVQFKYRDPWQGGATSRLAFNRNPKVVCIGQLRDTFVTKGKSSGSVEPANPM